MRYAIKADGLVTGYAAFTLGPVSLGRQDHAHQVPIGPGGA